MSYLGHEIHDRQLYIFLEYMPEGSQSIGDRVKVSCVSPDAPRGQALSRTRLKSLVHFRRLAACTMLCPAGGAGCCEACKTCRV